MVYCATSVWIPIVSDMPQGSVMGPVLFILFTSEIFELMEYRLHAYADHSALLAVAHKPADRPAVAVLARSTVFRNGAITPWCLILHPNKRTCNNDLLEKDCATKNCIHKYIQVWHSRSRQFISTAIKPVHYNKLD